MSNRTFQLFWLCQCLALVYPYLCDANTIHVPGDQTTIQAGISVALDGDTVLVAPGIYTGEGNREIELLGKAIVVISVAGAEATIIDAEGIGKYGFYLHEEEDQQTVIKGFKVINVTAGNFFSATGIYLDDSSPTIENCILENNKRGLFLEQTSAIISGCTVSNNTTWGGITNRFSSSDAVIRNCLIVGNTSTVGGGIRVDLSLSPLYINCTIAGNNATQSGGGIFVGGDELLRMRNSIIWGNTAPEAPNLNGYVFDITYSNIEGLCIPQKGNISEDPQFTGENYQLDPGSPCIDTGSPAEGLEADNTQSNMGRYGHTAAATVGNANLPVLETLAPEAGPAEGGGTMTITGLRFGNNPGAVTFGGVSASINSWSDTEIQCQIPEHDPGQVPLEVQVSGGLSTALPFAYHFAGGAIHRVPAEYSTIQAAINCAIDGDTVLVAPGTYTGDGNRKISLLGKAITVISEAGAEQTILDGEGTGEYGFLLHQDEGPQTHIKGFKIINFTAGNFSSATGIYIDDGSSPTVSDCILEGNGRGIHLEFTSAVISGCIIRNNTRWGGISCRSGSSAAVIRNCLVTGNSGSSGGGISVVFTQSPTLIHCTIVGNSASQSGGGIFISDDRTLRMRNCIIWGNTASDRPNVAGYQFEVTYTDIEDLCIPQKGNLSEDPQLTDELFHLSPTSPCVDSGSPEDGLDPDGSQANMGYYGLTQAATPGRTDLPIIEQVSPETGPPSGGELVTITGQRFGNSPGTIKADGVAASISSWSANEIQCQLPGQDPGFVTLEVTTATGASSQLTFGYRYEGSAMLHVPSNFPTIQAAIDCAMDGDTILVAPGTYTGVGNREINLSGKAVAVISEAGPEQTTLDLEGLSINGFIVDQGEDQNTLIKGFRITNSASGLYFSAGAIHIEDSSPTIQDCILENNGRGLYLERSDAIVEHCIIQNNGPWGGIFNRYNTDGALFTHCLINSNYSRNDGGGISMENNVLSPLFINCTVVNNSAQKTGGGIYASGTSGILRMRNTIVWANNAPESPGIAADTAAITYSDIQGGWGGEGNIDIDPCFADFFAADFHLSPVSPGIDSGDPGDDFSREPQPNGGRVNMGFYGNTAEASSFEPQMVIKDFSYELGCEPSRLVTLSGYFFGNTQGEGKVWLGGTEVATITNWTDTLVQFSADANHLEGNSIILATDTGARDTIPGDHLYAPYAQYIEGEVSGIWTAECPGIYILTGSVLIPSGEKLVIEPGVQVLVDRRRAGSTASFTVEGSLEAIGTIEAPIQFSLLPYQAAPGGWAGLQIDLQSGTDNTLMRHCLVEYAFNGITIKDRKTEIDSCTIQYSRDNGIFWDVQHESVTGSLKNSQLIHNGGYGIKIAAIGRSSGSANASPEIHQNLIANNQKGGISISAQAFTPFSGGAFRSALANPTISNNIIRHNAGFGVNCLADGDWADGIPFNFVYTAYANPRLEGNLITNNQGGFRTITRPTGGTTWNSESEPKIINCTIANNADVGIVAGDSSIVRVTNSIIVGSSHSIETQGGGRLEAAYSTILPQVAGEAMVEDIPQFYDAPHGDFRLLATSAQIDAGNNEAISLAEDLQGNPRVLDGQDSGEPTVDIGAYEYKHLQLLSQSSDLDICAGTAFLLSVAASGNELRYQWAKDGVPITGAESPEFEVAKATVTDAGSYSCTVTDELGGQVTSAPIQVQVSQSLEVSISIDATSTEICTGESVQFTAVVSNEGDAPTYTWKLNGAIVSNAASWSFDDFEDGDEVSCELVSSVTCVANPEVVRSVILQVSELPVPTISGTAVLCEGESSTLTAAGGSEYQWSTGEETAAITVEEAGTYTVTVTNAQGCSNATSASVTVNAIPSPAIAGVLEICEGENTTLTASGGDTYSWDNGEETPSITVDQAGTYTVTVTNAQGCTSATSASVTVNALPSPAISGVLEICEGENTTLTASGGDTYSWDNGADTPSITVGQGGTYTVTVTNTQGCASVTATSVTVNAIPSPAISGVLEICEGENTTLTASGGATYSWDNGADTPSITVDQAGLYSVVITGNQGCTASTSVAVAVNELPEVELSLERDTFCIGESPIVLSGGTPEQGQYSGPGITENTLHPDVAGLGDHTLVYEATDENGCAASSSQFITIVEESANCLVNSLRRVSVPSINIYPNPASRRITIKWDPSFENLTGRSLLVQNVLGQRGAIRSLVPDGIGHKMTLDVSEWTPGVYLLSLWRGNELLGNGKLVIF